MLNDEMKIRCIGMKELHQRHTGEYLCEIIRNCIHEYGAQMKQMHSVTTDNAKNMKNTIRQMNKNLDDDEHEVIEENVQVETNENNPVNILNSNEFSEENHRLYDIEIANIVNQDIGMEEELEITRLLEGQNLDETAEDNWIFTDYSDDINLPQVFAQQDLLAGIFINDINCAAHSIQSCVKDALNALDLPHQNVIKLCRQVSKFIRTGNAIIAIKNNGLKLKLPALDVVTRWSSTYLMVSRKKTIYTSIL